MMSAPVPCPTCGKQPTIGRYRSSYWRVTCQHTWPVAGHPMKTQREAVEQWNIERVNDAVRGAIAACHDDKSTFPAAPEGWAHRAQAALDSGTHALVVAAGLDLRSAHSQHAADFDRMPALYALRLALPHPLRDYAKANAVG